jgi:hypothetical protein
MDTPKEVPGLTKEDILRDLAQFVVPRREEGAAGGVTVAEFMEDSKLGRKLALKKLNELVELGLYVKVRRRGIRGHEQDVYIKVK